MTISTKTLKNKKMIKEINYIKIKSLNLQMKLANFKLMLAYRFMKSIKKVTQCTGWSLDEHCMGYVGQFS